MSVLLTLSVTAEATEMSGAIEFRESEREREGERVVSRLCIFPAVLPC